MRLKNTRGRGEYAFACLVWAESVQIGTVPIFNYPVGNFFALPQVRMLMK